MKKLSSLSIFFPVYNDAYGIPYLIVKIYSILPQIADKFEVILVNDGSTDETEEIALYLKKQYLNLKVVSHKKNRGYGDALQTGFKHARYDWVFYTDGDLQYNPQEIAKLVNKVSPKVDVVNGYKIKRHDPLIRIVMGTLYSKILHFMYKLPIRDVDCDFRLIRKAVLEKIELTSNSGFICLELVEKLAFEGAKFREVPIHHYNRIFGRSQFFKPSNLLKTFQENIDYFRIRHKKHA